jgi:hypothetical protein
VRQADGRPLTAATLTLIDMAGRQAGLTHTRADGSYRLIAPTEGVYLLVATTRSHRPSASTINLQGSPTEHEIILYGGGTLPEVDRLAKHQPPCS